MTDTSDKAVQKALEILEIAALTHDDFTASDTCAAAFATVKARIEADAAEKRWLAETIAQIEGGAMNADEWLWAAQRAREQERP